MSNTSIISYIILTLSIGYVFVYSPTQDLNALLSKKQEYESTLSTIGNIENIKNEMLTKFNSIPAADRQKIDTVLPDSFDFVNLISQIDSVAAKYGISINTISSRTVDPSVGDSVATAQPPKPYQSAVIGFSFDTTYDKFNAFVADLEKSMRILDVKSVKLTVKEGSVYSYEVQFQTYWLNQS